MSAPTFGPIPPELLAPEPGHSGRQARFHLKSLDAYMEVSKELSKHPYGMGSWGYTVLRIVYTPESDTMFPIAMERLRTWVKYFLYQERMPHYPPFPAGPMANVALNDELWSRFHLDVVEDKDKLDMEGPLTEASFHTLRDYFRKWVAGLGQDPDEAYIEGYGNSRFCDPIIIDAEALATLCGLPEETPPNRPPVDREEWYKFVRMRKKGWVWVLDTIALGERQYWGGWLKAEVLVLGTLFFSRLCVEASYGLPRDKQGKPEDSEADWWLTQHA